MGTFTIHLEGDHVALANMAKVLTGISDMIGSDSQAKIDAAAAKLVEAAGRLRESNTRLKAALEKQEEGNAS